MAQVVLKNLTKSYVEKDGRSVTAVRGIDLAIADGEFMVIIGPSGCGKSTTLRMISGLEPISGGTISIGDRVVNDVLPKDRDIAMVFQNYALYPHMSVYENLAFGLRLRGLPREQIDTRVREAAAFLGLESYLERRPKALSGGQRQRVAVGRAIVRQPKVFLFDEPLSNLDAKMRVSTRAELAKLHSRLKTTVIYVTHDQAEAMTLGDRICVMRNGSVMQVAKPLELYHQPKHLFVAGFIGSPPMNFFRGALRSEGDSVYFSEDNRTATPAVVRLPSAWSVRAQAHLGRPVVLGVRPEDIEEAGGQLRPGSLEPVEGVVELSEPLGAETHHYLTTGSSNFIMRTTTAAEYAIGARVQVRFRPERIHLFDAETELAL